MVHLKTRTACPPGGFMFYQPETRWESHKAQPETRWDFKQLVKAVRQHRLKHPQFRFVTDPSKIADEIDHENAMRLMSVDRAWNYVIRDAAPIHFLPSVKIPDHLMIVRRTAALGDVLAATCLVSKLFEHGIGVIFQSHPASHCLLRLVPGLAGYEEPKGIPTINLDDCYENDPRRCERTFADMFIQRANESLGPKHFNLRPTNCTPRLVLPEPEKLAHRRHLEIHPKPWVFVCPRSQSWVNRTVTNEIWEAAAPGIRGTKFWLGMNNAPQGFVDLQCRHFDDVIRFLANADLLISVDTGPLHVSAALQIPIIAINQSSSPECHLSDQNDFLVIQPPLDCLNCQKPRCPIDPVHPPCQKIDPQLIARTANQRLAMSVSGEVSAVISIYRPAAAQLNRCLDAILLQVNEIKVVVDKAGAIPDDARIHPKIQYLYHPQSDVGFGRKSNYGARHTNGEFILFLNDDVYLESNAVSQLKHEMRPGIGVVTHTLFYPDGTIQHGGKYRQLGQINGWSHIDFRARKSRFTIPVEQETMCGASALIRRTAFYQAGCFDEDYYLYCEDDDLGLKIRQAGWKILFTPHASGIHEEHVSTSKTPNMGGVMARSCAFFHNRWKWYLERNRNVEMGTFA